MQEAATTTVQPLLDYFDRLIPLNKEVKELIRSKFHPHLFLKKQFGSNMDGCANISILLSAGAFVFTWYNSQLSIIPKAGHVVFMTNFAAVWESLAPFLKE